MADPVTIAIGAAVVSAIGSIRQGNAANESAKYNAAQIEQSAGIERAQATIKQEDQRAQARSVIGRQLATVAESGTGLSGSNLDLLGESMYNAEMDALNIRYGSELNAVSSLNQANVTRREGKNARTAGYLSAASSLASAGAGYMGGRPFSAGSSTTVGTMAGNGPSTVGMSY